MYYKQGQIQSCYYSINHLGFCPVKCGKDEMICPGNYDYETGKQASPDTCMPIKGFKCNNHCAVTCGGKEHQCPGGMGWDDCPMPDFCWPIDSK